MTGRGGETHCDSQQLSTKSTPCNPMEPIIQPQTSYSVLLAVVSMHLLLEERPLSRVSSEVSLFVIDTIAYIHAWDVIPPYVRGRHFFVVSHVVGPTTTLQVQFWGGPLDRSPD